MREVLWFVLASVYLVGCDGSGDDDVAADGDADSDVDSDGDGDSDADADGDGDGDAETFDAGIGPIHIDQGEERTVCIEKRLGNAAPIWLHSIHSNLTEGGHHSILYRSTATEEHLEPFDCTPFVETLCGENVPLIITQKDEETLTYPDGVAVELAADQMVRIEVHFLNATPDALDVSEAFTLTTIPEAAVEREADFLFLGSPDIHVGAGEGATLGPRFVELPSDLEDIEIFALTGHTHRFGRDVSLWLSQSDGDLSNKVYPSGVYDWEEPEVAFYDPPLAVPAGAGLSIQCTWENTSGQDVEFGESANAEMCFAWAYYTTARGYQICFQSEEAIPGVPVTACCPGDPVCGAAADFLGCN